MRGLRLLSLAVTAAGALAAPAPAQQARNTLWSSVSGPVLTLDDAIRLALGNNKSLKVVAFERPIARAQLLTARGQFDPALVVSRIAEQNLTPATITPPPIFETYKTDIYNKGLQGQIPWGSTYTVGEQGEQQPLRIRGLYQQLPDHGQLLGHSAAPQGLRLPAPPCVNVRIAKAQRSISDYDYRLSAINAVTSVVIACQQHQFAHRRTRRRAPHARPRPDSPGRQREEREDQLPRPERDVDPGCGPRRPPTKVGPHLRAPAPRLREHTARV